ncbi:glycosyltransferase family 2 protein [Sagittula sp. NFXS13]|uniref:glycosyltransferase family 2 protein n=1 Tax=Sagittula sp. NFXS13 TaxID=2819095 RepID=UPI0032DF029F
MSSPPRRISALLTQYETRRDAIDCAEGEGLPDPDMDLHPLTLQIVADPNLDPTWKAPFRSGFHRKSHAIRQELQGLSELCSLHGLLISHLRKRDIPEHAPVLFHRLWAEHGDHLLTHLDSRWLVSAVTTFGDHGLTAEQRCTGLALSTLFSMMKLYETERMYSDHAPDQPFSARHRQKADLPLDMDPYALVGGGLDVNTLARLWTEAARDAVIAPLAHHLLRALLDDKRALFSRLAEMRAEKETKRAQKPHNASPRAGAKQPPEPRQNAPVDQSQLPASVAELRWGLVTTTNAPLDQIARFAAHHIDLGAERLHIYLDRTNPEAEAFLTHPRIHLTSTDAAYWDGHAKCRPDAHQLRQAFNATRCLHGPAAQHHWLGHIDVDEFLLCEKPIAQLLFDAPNSAAFVRIPPAEALACAGQPRHFKLTHAQANVKKAELQDIYPTFGMHLYGGFLSHTSGKIFARTGIPNTRLGIHALKYKGQDAGNRYKPNGLLLAHLHTPSWDHFMAHLDFRLEKGSYRPRSERPELGQAELLRFLQQEDGGLRAFFDEVIADTPDLRERLRKRGMLITQDLALDAKVARVFGRLP